jgi:hypothetical protein
MKRELMDKIGIAISQRMERLSRGQTNHHNAPDYSMTRETKNWNKGVWQNCRTVQTGVMEVRYKKSVENVFPH